MRAVLVERFGGVEALKWVGDLPVPEPGLREVRVRVFAAGVNPRDALQREGGLGDAPPLIPGAEVSGVVDEVGAGVDRWSPGDEVFARVDGAYADYAIASADTVFAKPPVLTHPEAAGIFITWGTSVHGLYTLAGLEPRHVLLVRAATSATGLAAVQLGALRGSRVIALVRNRQREDLVRRLGATDVIVCPGDRFAEAVLEAAPDGVDLAFDGVGGPAVGEVVRTLAVHGRYVLYGYLGGFDAAIHVPDLVRRNATMIGFSLSMDPRAVETLDRLREEIVPALAHGRLRPLPVRQLPLADAAEAHRLLAAGGIGGKLALCSSSTSGEEGPS